MRFTLSLPADWTPARSAANATAIVFSSFRHPSATITVGRLRPLPRDASAWVRGELVAAACTPVEMDSTWSFKTPDGLSSTFVDGRASVARVRGVFQRRHGQGVAVVLCADERRYEGPALVLLEALAGATLDTTLPAR